MLSRCAFIYLDVGRADDSEDAFELVGLVAPGKEWFEVAELGEDAPNAPDIDGDRVVLGPQQDIGRPVP